jgi:hypothetical protein
METKDDELLDALRYAYTGNKSLSNWDLSALTGIELPETFKKVIMKLHSEIADVVALEYNVHKKYNPINFDAVSYFMVNLTVYFNENNIPKGDKSFYNESFNDLFKMTYGSDMDFVTFSVISMVVPPAKSNEVKFMELFGKNHAKNN